MANLLTLYLVVGFRKMRTIELDDRKRMVRFFGINKRRTRDSISKLLIKYNVHWSSNVIFTLTYVISVRIAFSLYLFFHPSEEDRLYLFNSLLFAYIFAFYAHLCFRFAITTMSYQRKSKNRDFFLVFLLIVFFFVCGFF